MWQYFWTYETDLPPGIGVETFGPVHLAWVAVALALIVLTVLIYRRLSPSGKQRMQMVIALLSIAGYLVRWTWAALIGHYSVKEMLPLQLCNLSAWLQLAAVLSNSKFLKELGYSCGLLGGVVSFIFVGMGPYPLLHFFYLQFILAHLILILLPSIWIWGDGYRPDWRWLPRCFGFLLLLAAVVVPLNALIGSNYLYLNYVPDSYMLKPISDFFGNPGYQFAMAGLLLVVWVVMYLPFALLKRRKNPAVEIRHQISEGSAPADRQ